MKALFTTFPAYGHLLPMLPLANAAAEAGDTVLVATHGDLHAAADGLPTRATGPSLAELLAENEARSGQDVLGDGPDLLAATIALFTTTYSDLAFEELLRLATEERPDVIVAEMWDYLAPLVARRLGIPWVTFVHSPATPIDPALAAGFAQLAARHHMPPPTPLATVQLWPDWLEAVPTSPAQPTIEIGSRAYDTAARADIPAFTGDRPVVLVTLGTVVDDLSLLRSAVRAVLDAGADALVTTGFTATPADLDADPDRVRAVSFAPISQLLDRAQAVIAAGGSGTTLATLSRGLPIAFVPRIANQPQIAATVTGFGAALTCDTPESLATAVPALLTTPTLRTRAEAAATRLTARPAPAGTWTTLRSLLP